MSNAAVPQRPAPAPDSLALLRHPGTIRARCRAVLEAVSDERSAWFRVDRARLADVAARVAALTRKRFPDLNVPPHSRWRHFEAGGVNRRAELEARLAGRSVLEAARARIDLAFVSVLLDAGAGPAWRYTDNDGQRYSRSEGLGVASLRAFVGGRFSAQADDPLRADASVLARVDAAALSGIFQVGPDNPMVGLEGRAALVARLGAVLLGARAAAGARPEEPPTPRAPQRPAQLLERLGLAGVTAGAAGADAARSGDAGEPPPGAGAGAAAGAMPAARVSPATLLQQVLVLTDGIFTQGTQVMGRGVGDVWAHRFAGNRVAGGGTDPVTAGVVPFHKLSQWLCYSLLEPLAWAGIEVADDDPAAGLTGLPEYRNGGLLLDAGVIVPRHAQLAERRFKPGDEAIVEWRALTVALLDELAPLVREHLGRGERELPLAAILEGGTWAAGREIALEKRAGGAPPLTIDSDGPVF
ncbi:MAG: DUF1688 family protein [Rubrivivax sp.]|nr:DUF1688 family protein [Rubrivivax sp.]